MKLNIFPSLLARSRPSAVIACVAAVVQTTCAQTLWTGPTTNFTQTVHNSTDADVLVAGKVSLTRSTSQWLFNAAAGETSASTPSPKDTMWAFGALSNYASLTYKTMDSLRNGDLGQVLGVPADGGTTTNMVLHLTNENIYLSVTFTAWGEHGAGGFAYTRSTPAPPTPTVSITSPVNGATFTAPASVTIDTTATVSSGTVTNVSFFAGATKLGSVTTSPFNFTATGLTAGNYALTAVATAAGVSATSAVVNITVNPPTPTVNITTPVSGATFTAPASVSISANASVSSGSVTNVAFFAGSTLLGSAQSAPFSITANNVSAGNYFLTAVATAAGISATSAPVSITVVPPTPTVSITNPVGGSVYAAPATLKLGATAAVSSGTVTNVAFFAGATLLGAVQTNPFKVTTGSLGAGNYSLTAVATAAGVSATSAVVSVSIVTPVVISNSLPAIVGGQFNFHYTANAGLRYVVQSSSNLIMWVPIATNVAAGSNVDFTDTSSLSTSRFYDVVRLPNP